MSDSSSAGIDGLLSEDHQDFCLVEYNVNTLWFSLHDFRNFQRHFIQYSRRQWLKRVSERVKVIKVSESVRVSGSSTAAIRSKLT